MDWAIVDIQGFKDNNNRFIVKEFYLETKNLTFHDIIKSPIGLKQKLNKQRKFQNNWLTQHFHGIDWNAGYITLNELRNTISHYLHNFNIYVKGKEKIEWIKQIMNNHDLSCFNLEDFKCDVSLCDNNEKYVTCKNHTHFIAIAATTTNSNTAQCAVKNVKVLKKWIQQNKSKLRKNCNSIV